MSDFGAAVNRFTLAARASSQCGPTRRLDAPFAGLMKKDHEQPRSLVSPRSIGESSQLGLRCIGPHTSAGAAMVSEIARGALVATFWLTVSATVTLIAMSLVDVLL